MKKWIRLAMVMLVGFLVFSLSMPGVALSAEINLPTGKNVPADYDPLPERRVELQDATVFADINYSGYVLNPPLLVYQPFAFFYDKKRLMAMFKFILAERLTPKPRT